MPQKQWQNKICWCFLKFTLMSSPAECQRSVCVPLLLCCCASEISSPHHQSLFFASLPNSAKEQRKLWQSILSCILLSDLILITALYVCLLVHNLQRLPISTELDVNFLVFRPSYILALPFLSSLIPYNYVSYKMNHCHSLDLLHFPRPWFVCTVCATQNTRKLFFLISVNTN